MLTSTQESAPSMVNGKTTKNILLRVRYKTGLLPLLPNFVLKVFTNSFKEKKKEADLKIYDN